MSGKAHGGNFDIWIANGVLWFKAYSIGDGDDVYASEPGLEVFMRPADIRTVHLGHRWLAVWDTHGTRYHVVVADENGHEVVARWIREFAMGETGGAG